MQVRYAVGATLLLSLLAGASQGPARHHSVWITSDLIGMKILTEQGEDLGEIEDIVVQPGGRTSYAVVSFGEWHGVDGQLFAMPWTELRTVEPDVTKKGATRSLVLPLTKERLKSAPSFDKKTWPVMAKADWSSNVDAFYTTGAAAKKAVEAGQRGAVIPWRVSEIVGTDVTTPTGDALGDVENLALDLDGRVCYAVLSVGGFIGIGDRHVAIPWDSFRFSLGGEKGDEKMISLLTSKEKLEKAPQFKPGKEDRAEMCGHKWITQVYEYHACPIYWSAPAEPAVQGTEKK